MSQENDENDNSQSAKVLKLGFNISVTGDPDADFEIVLDDKANVNVPSIHCESQSSDLSKVQNVPKTKVELKTKASSEVDSIKMSKKETSINNQTSMSRESSSDNPESSSSKELSLINDIKSTMQHFERFSDHIREVPRFKIGPIASSTPFPDKKYSKSELNLVHPERRYGRYSHTFYDFNTRREYMRGKPLPSDLFLRPLPGADLYRRGMFRYDNDPLMMYGSMDSLMKSSSKYTSSDRKTNLDDEKYGLGETPPEVSSGILKKSDHDSGEKSTSSAESVKDIKIYQNGGILIMQNFKENLDVEEKRDISDLSAKLIANCKRLKEEIESDCTQLPKPTILYSSGESQSSGKMVQFDLLESDYQKNKLDTVNSSLAAKVDFPLKPETLDFSERDSILENQTCQDFLSMSTQDDSIVSNAPGMSPGASGKKLEWDSGADVGYLNLDLSKENLSTIEKIVLRGLSSDGLEKNVVYEKKSQEPYYSNSKVILERKPSEIIIEEIVEVKNAWEAENKGCDVTPEVDQGETPIKTLRDGQENEGMEFKKKHDRALKGFAESKSSEPEKPNSFKEFLQHVYRHNSREKAVDSTVNFFGVNTVLSGESSTTAVDKPSKGDNLKESEPSTHSKISKIASKGKRAKKKSERQKSQVPCAISREKLADPQSSKVDKNLTCSMKIPKKLYKKQEARPESSDVKGGRKEKEIEVDRSSETKERVTVEGKEPEKNVSETNNESDCKKPLKKPESATSTKTVLWNSQAKNSKERDKSEKNLFIDEMIQTNEYKVESVGVQAFSSQKSSVFNTSSSRRSESDPRKPPKNTSQTHVSSKNIQVFGTNSSLPKELGHPKESNLQDVHNTKGTQFFGEPIGSLPNYHSHQISKSEGSSRRIFQVLKTKKSPESEKMTADEENKRNIMANDSIQKIIEEKKKSNEGISVPEDKENLLEVKTVEENSDIKKEEMMSVEQTKKKRSEGDVSRVKESKKAKKELLNSLTPSDGISCKSLTSEHLKQHGDSIDRNLIKEIYFQSQLVEIGKREMISKSTSMDILFEPIKYSTPAEKVTVGCQYSLRSKEGTKGSKEPSECIEDKEDKTCHEQGDSYHSSSGSNQIKEEENYTSKGGLQGCGTGDSFPSSTQTANSWVPGMQDSSQNNGNAVGRARSFEYLPGHIYESSGNLREKLPSENEENVITGSSSDLEESETTNERRRKETDDGEKSSEGRKTLVLENSNDVSWDSCQLKSLDENLTRLNIVVTRLREKDDQIRKITRSVLVNLWRHNGSGDGVQFLDTDTPETKIHDRIDKRANQRKKKKPRGKESSPEENVLEEKERNESRKIEKRDNDVSIGCQTEPKTAEHTLEKYQNERKELESRLAADKESQIKWIEKEIYHLNVLRGILEKQTSLNSRRKQSPNGVVMTDESQNGVKIPTKEVHPEDYQRPVTPVYGCTISVLENSDMNKNGVPSEEKNTTGSREEGIEDPTTLNNTKYGMAVSLNGNLRKVMLLPVGVQVSLNNADFNGNRLKEELSEPENNKRHTHRSRPTSRCQGSGKEHGRQSDVMTQYPSAKKLDRGHPSTSVQADLPSPADCGFCHQKTCVCLSLSPSENSEALTDRYSKGERTLSDRPASSKRLVESGFNQSEQKTMSNTTGTSTLNVESLPESNQRFHGKTNERSADSTTITSRGKGMTCQCENCPRRNTSRISKPLSTHKQSQSTSGLNHKKCMNDPSSGSCRCTKMQVMKSSACHVIKIVGPSCCSSEDGTCYCKNRNIKKTENQSCQTENIIIENKELVTNSEIVKPNKEPGIIYPVEGKMAVERRHSVDEKYLYSPKVSYDRRQSQQEKLGLIEKNATQKHSSEDDTFTGTETPAPPGTCDCNKNKKKQKKDDHPRHYFLKIEEREMDESNESSERRRSLEVITVTVPVKKAGRAKIYKNDIIQTSNIQRTETNSLTNKGRKGCTCCKECIDQKSNVNSFQDSCQDSRKVPAEKPDSYRKIMKNHKSVAESKFGENVGVCGEEFGYNASSSSQEDGNRDRPDYGQSGPYRERQRMRENVAADCYSRDSPSDYDSHTDYRPQSSGYFVKESHKGKKSAMVERYVAEEPFEEEPVSRASKSRKHFPDPIPYDSDYYNYDKREFMTKSEILREEQKKKKNHQPSLQEYLESNRPDFCSSAESRRRIISERARERVKNHGNRIECLMNLMHQCQTKNGGTKRNEGTKRIFTTPQMREQTMKRYRQLPEVTEKVADQKKKEEYKTNKLMADIFAKKLQLEALKGHINLSNSVSVLSTI